MQPNIMIRAFLAISVVALTAIGSASGQTNTAESNANQVAWLQYISTELRRIHLELLEDRRDLQKARLQGLERDLESVQAEQRQLQVEQRSQAQQAADIDAQLAQSNLTKAERDEMESQRADLVNAPPSRFGAAQNALAQREAHARDRLATQEQQVQALERQIRELSAGMQ